VHIWPLDPAICQRSEEPDFTTDPADELIAATSIVHRIPLLTRDRNPAIEDGASGSGVKPDLYN